MPVTDSFFNREAERNLAIAISQYDELLQLIPLLDVKSILRAFRRVEAVAAVSVRRTGSCLVMAQAFDCFATAFNIGEVLVTEVEVDIEGHSGYGMVAGDVPEMALLAAAVDALDASNMHREMHDIARYIRRQAKRALARREIESRLAARTRVHFESMGPD
jgi:phosphonate C-P lyase system protein PhnG